jgi:hypothetical protein
MTSSSDKEFALTLGLPLYAVFQIFISLFFGTIILASAHQRYPGIREDGCLWILSILGSFLLTLLWPITIPLALYIYLGVAPGQGCCGMACNTWLQRRRSGVDEEQAIPGHGHGVANQQPGGHQGMELPTHVPATA